MKERKCNFWTPKKLDFWTQIILFIHVLGNSANVDVQDHSFQEIRNNDETTPNADNSEAVIVDSITTTDKTKTQCYYCAQMIDLTEIKKHMISAHSFYVDKMHGPARSFRCYKCEKTFETPSAMGIHDCIASKGNEYIFTKY